MPKLKTEQVVVPPGDVIHPYIVYKGIGVRVIFGQFRGNWFDYVIEHLVNTRDGLGNQTERWVPYPQTEEGTSTAVNDLLQDMFGEVGVESRDSNTGKLPVTFKRKDVHDFTRVIRATNYENYDAVGGEE